MCEEECMVHVCVSCTLTGGVHVCQSRVEIEHYSVVYFNRIIVFKALQRKTSVKGRAHMHSKDT